MIKARGGLRPESRVSSPHSGIVPVRSPPPRRFLPLKVPFQLNASYREWGCAPAHLVGVSFFRRSIRRKTMLPRRPTPSNIAEPTKHVRPMARYSPLFDLLNQQR